MRSTAAWLLVAVALLAGCNSRRGGTWEPAGEAKAPLVRPIADAGLIPSDRVSAVASDVVAGVFTALPLGAMLVAALALVWVHRRRARVERAVDGRALLADGPQRITGVIEADPAAPGPPMVVHIHQRATEIRTKGGYSHQWKEVSRDVLARPFHVRRDDGLVVRVEPDAAALLQADLSLEQRHSRDSRTRSAEVRAGTRVQVAGQLAGAPRQHVEAVYRAAPGAPVLVAPRGGRLVISSEPPGATASKRARFHTGWAVALAAVMALLGGSLVNTYAVLVVDGTLVSATPTQTRRWEEWVKPKNSPGRWVPHYGVRAQAKLGGETLTLEDESSVSVHACVKAGTCPRLPFLVAEHFPSVHQIGHGATLSAGILALLVTLTLVLLVAYPASAAPSRPWYLKSKVVDGKAGRLDG